MVTPPPVAVMVRVELPVDADEAAARVKVLEPLPGEAMLVGANVPVTPDGSPLTDNATAELKPFPPAVVTLIGVDAPAATLAFVVLVFSVRVGFATAKVMVWVWIRFPLVPVIARTEVPTAAPEAADTVKVLVPFPEAMLEGEKPAVTPAGSPLTDNATAELNPFKAVTVTINVVELPTFTLAPVGLGSMVKLTAETVTVNSIVRLNPPPDPVTVMGKVPPAALLVALTVIVTGEEVFSVGEEKVTVTPAGAPAAERVTGELNPPCALMVTVAVVVLPGATVRLEDKELRLKFEARLLLQLLTSRKASTEPSPVVISYPGPAL